MRSLIAFTCLFALSLNANATSEKENWRDTGLTSAIARGLLNDNRRCSQSSQAANACLQGAHALIEHYQPKIQWLVRKDVPTDTIRSFGNLHLIEGGLKAQIPFEEPVIKAFAADHYRSIYSYLDAILTWAFDELVPAGEDALAAGILLNGYYRTANDSYTYIEPEVELQQKFTENPAKIVGIGVILEPVDKGLLVEFIVPNSPALKAGLHIGDIITAIDQISIQNNEAIIVADAISGKPNSSVKLSILRKNKQMLLVAKRAPIIFEKVTVNYIETEADKLAVIYISTFMNRNICKDVERAINSAHKNGATGIVFDLRSNGGGLVDEAACVAGLVLPRNAKLLSFRKIGNHRFTKPPIWNEREPITTLPVAVFQNESSASAAETLAVLIQDFERGAIIGRPSFGKGIVQTIVSWPSEEPYLIQKSLNTIDFSFTTFFYESGMGRLIHRQGVQPDFQVAASDTSYASENDTPGSPQLPDSYREPAQPSLPKELHRCMAAPDVHETDDESDPYVVLTKKFFGCNRQFLEATARPQNSRSN